jgi:hypothetical protein
VRQGRDIRQGIRNAWQRAAVDLGLSVRDPADTTSAVAPTPFVAWAADFGSPAGTVCGLNDAPDLDRRPARTGGMGACEHDAYPSFLSESYASYDRELFAATLDDWGWSGLGDPPDWHTGAPWAGE